MTDDVIRQIDRNGALPFSPQVLNSLYYEFFTKVRRIKYEQPLLEIALQLDGALDANELQRAIMEINRRHEILRTAYVPVISIDPPEVRTAGNAINVATGSLKPSVRFDQEIYQEVDVSIPILSLEGLEPWEREKEVLRVTEMIRMTAFDYARPPLFRASLIRIGAVTHLLTIVVAHLVFDAWSLSIFQRELFILYGAFSNSLVSPLPPLSYQYLDLVNWQNHRLYQNQLQTSVEFWKKEYEKCTILQADQLKFAQPKGLIADSRTQQERLEISANTSHALRRFAQEKSVTMFALFLSSFYILLRHCVDGEYIGVWGFLANRSRAEFASAIGWFAQSHMLSMACPGDRMTWDLLDGVQRKLAQAVKHQEIPMPLVLKTLGINSPLRGESAAMSPDAGSPVSFELRVFPRILSPINLKITQHQPELRSHTQWGLRVALVVKGDVLSLSAIYPFERFSRETIRVLLRCLHDVATHISTSANSSIGNLEYLVRPLTRISHEC